MVVNQLVRRHVDLLRTFLLEKIELREPETDESFKALVNSLGLSLDRRAGLGLGEIHRDWNLGLFTDFSPYLDIDQRITARGSADEALYYPNLFANAQAELENKLTEDDYRIEFHAYQAELREAGGYEKLAYPREKFMLRIMNRASPELERIRQERLERQNAIRNTFPSSWNKTPIELTRETGLNISEQDIQIAKTNAVREWFSGKKLGSPSDEQATVIANCHNSLKVVARAGSGKTRTIAQKILFLIHYLNFKPDEVLGLVFNRKAREELERRIKQYEHEAGLPSRGAFKILTFDALAYNLVKPQSTLLTDAGQRKLIKDIVLNAIDNEEGLSKQVEELMISSFKGDWEKTIRLNSVSSQLDLERLRSFLTEETLDGKEVKSRPEKRIADFLFEHDIPYRYEMPFIVDDGNIIRPDFYLPTFRVVIEYYGLRGDTDYEKSIEYKRQYWTYRNDIILIEINPGFICKSETNFDDSRDDDYQALCNLLTESTKHTNSTIQPKRLTDEEIIAKLRDRIRLTFVELLQSAITRAGQMNCSDIDLIEQIAQYKASSDEERSFLDLLSKFIVMYRDRLANNNLTDYNEIKKEAIGKIVDGMTALDWDRGSNGINLRSVKHIFVDEFQDFSELFRGILLAILKAAPEAVVNAVGDDWQMINRFAGSKPELFDQFDRDYPKPRTVYLQTNYRSSGGIVEFCNAIMKANGVNGKPAIPCDSKRADCFKISRLDRDQITITPREDHYFNGDCILSSIFRIYKPLTEQFRADSKTDGDRICLAISRSNNPPVQVVPDELGIRASNNRETINKMVDRLTPDNISQFFEAITGHKSKGLEADAVIVLQPKQYPMIRKRSVFLQFFGDSPANLLRDELNLFYVICSRAIQDLYFLPESEQMMSLFALSLQGSITALSWDDFPCRLSGPAALHTILVQNGNRDSAALFAAKDMLLGLGFDVFSRPKKIPTRSQLVRQDLYGTLKLLHKTVQSCPELDLKYIIKDGLNHQVFCFPGPQSIQEAMNQLQDAR